MSVPAGNDAVTQNADSFVAGATAVNAGTGDITCPAGNDFRARSR